MEAESRYTYVGAAVIGLVIALVAAVLWLKNVGGRNYEHYAIYFQNQALDGLDVGASVTLRGIQVGRVDDYALSGDTLNRVRVEIRVDRRTPVRTNTVAIVTRNFVTGIATIALVNREPPGPPLTEVPASDVYPVIAEGRSGLDDIAGRVDKVGRVASDALENIGLLVSAENRAELMATVKSLRQLSDGIREQLGPLGASVGAVATAATQTGNAARALGRSGERIATVAERTGSQLDSTLAQSEQTLAATRQALARMTAAVEAVQQQALATAQRLEASAAHADDQLGAAVSELRLSTETATRTLDRLRDPRASLLGPSKGQLGPGEKLP